MSNTNPGPLVATYVFKSTKNETIYVIHAFTLNLRHIKSIDNAKAEGYEITQGTVTALLGKSSVTYTIPQSTNNQITNALWLNADDSQSGTGPWCAGIDRLLLIGTPTVQNVSAAAGVNETLIFNFGNGILDTATLLYSTFPPIPVG